VYDGVNVSRVKGSEISALASPQQSNNFSFRGSSYKKGTAASGVNTAYSENVVYLMDEEEYCASNDFLVNSIMPQILKEWRENDSELVKSFVKQSERFVPPTEVLFEWGGLLDAEVEQSHKLQLVKDNNELRRIMQAVETFTLLKQRELEARERKETKAKRAPRHEEHREDGKGSGVVSTTKRPPKYIKTVKHSDLLPNQFATYAVSWLLNSIKFF
jgi:hypothetical protein